MALGNLFVGIVAALHTFFAYLEILMWEKPEGRSAFGQTRESAANTAVMAKNQGLYNLFMVAGMLYSLYLNQDLWKRFFMWCIVAAGLWGALTTGMFKILAIQSGPAILALYFLSSN